MNFKMRATDIFIVKTWNFQTLFRYHNNFLITIKKNNNKNLISTNTVLLNNIDSILSLAMGVISVYEMLLYILVY